MNNEPSVLVVLGFSVMLWKQGNKLVWPNRMYQSINKLVALKTLIQS